MFGIGKTKLIELLYDTAAEKLLSLLNQLHCVLGLDDKEEAEEAEEPEKPDDDDKETNSETGTEVIDEEGDKTFNRLKH